MLKKALFIVVLFLMSCKADEKKSAVASTLQENTPKNIINKEGVVLEVYDYEGFESFLNRDDGKTYVINFWATWCKPCIEELPYFEQLNKNYKDKDVEVILVSIDMPRMIESQLIPFIKKRKLQSKVILLDDPKENVWISKIDENWSGALPATLMYKSNTKAFYEQSFVYEELEDQLLKILN